MNVFCFCRFAFSLPDSAVQPGDDTFAVRATFVKDPHVPHLALSVVNRFDAFAFDVVVGPQPSSVTCPSASNPTPSSAGLTPGSSAPPDEPATKRPAGQSDGLVFATAGELARATASTATPPTNTLPHRIRAGDSTFGVRMPPRPA